MKNIKNFENFITESFNREADDVYENSLKDIYWKTVSKKFPDYNNPDSEDNAKAVDFILSCMKEKYSTANWKIIQKDIINKIKAGLT